MTNGYYCIEDRAKARAAGATALLLRAMRTELRRLRRSEPFIMANGQNRIDWLTRQIALVEADAK